MNRTKRYALAALCSVSLGFVCLTGQAARADDGTTPTPITDKTYMIGVDDIIMISSAGHEDITQERQVLPDGYLHVNGLDTPIYAIGLTVPELRAKIFKGLDRLYNNLELSVSIREVNSKKVSIVGARGSGSFPLRKDMRVSTLIALAGGSPGKTKYVVGNLIRGSEKIKLNMIKIIGPDPDTSADPLLQAGDMVVLDLREDAPAPTYSVLGSVARGGAFPMPLDGSPISIARAVAEAGGKNEHAALSKVILQRKGHEQTLNLYPLLVEGRADSPEGQIIMQDGDVLIVPEIRRKYTVSGNVNRAGTYYMPEEKEIRVVDAVSEAGGAAASGEQRKATLVRLVNGKPVRYDINLLDIYNKGKVENNYVIQDGDVVFLPGRSAPPDPSAFLNPLYIFSNLFNSRLFGQ